MVAELPATAGPAQVSGGHHPEPRDAFRQRVHEMRNLLSAIIGSAAAATRAEPDRMRVYLEQIASAGMRGSELLWEIDGMVEAMRRPGDAPAVRSGHLSEPAAGNLLVVDPATAASAAIVARLVRRGHIVRLMPDSAEALALLRNKPGVFDLVVEFVPPRDPSPSALALGLAEVPAAPVLLGIDRGLAEQAPDTAEFNAAVEQLQVRIGEQLPTF